MFQQKNGLMFNNLCIDPHRSPKEKNVFFSHAHADHIKLSKTAKFFSTPQTIDLIKKRYPRKYDIDFNSLSFNKKINFDDFELILKENGHILGSSQIDLFFDSSKNTVTSDFRLQDSLLFKGAKPTKTDTLVLETTFGSPEYVFPAQKEVINSMLDWINLNTKKGLVVLSGYSLGKAQELTKIANLSGHVPVVHESIFEMNKIYEKHGKKLGKYKKLDHNIADSQILILPPNLVNGFLISALKEFHGKDIKTALATGWSYARGFDKTFPLSNHADYNDLIAYVEQCNPKLVLTDHGFCEQFSRKLNRLGYNSKPLTQYKQKGLFEF